MKTRLTQMMAILGMVTLVAMPEARASDGEKVFKGTGVLTMVSNTIVGESVPSYFPGGSAPIVVLAHLYPFEIRYTNKAESDAPIALHHQALVGGIHGTAEARRALAERIQLAISRRYGAPRVQYQINRTQRAQQIYETLSVTILDPYTDEPLVTLESTVAQMKELQE